MAPAAIAARVPEWGQGLEQAAELVLVEGLGEIADIDQGVIARNHRGGGNGHQGVDAAMAPAALAARVPEWGQGLEQAAGLLAAQRIMWGRRLPAIGRPRRRQERSREDLGGVGDQRIKEEGLRLRVELVEIQAGAAEAFGQADFNPLGRPVTSALEALGVHIGFDQEDGVAVAF